jgi:hypothetical protein
MNLHTANEIVHGNQPTSANELAAAQAFLAGLGEPVETEKVEHIKNGEFVRRNVYAKKTYRKAGYDFSSKTFTLVDCDDIGRSISVKRGTALVVGFTY